MFKPMVIPNTPIQKDPAPLRIDNFGGVDFSTTPTQIAENRSPDMLNMTLDERGKPSKRPGYDKVFTTSLGAGQINGLYEYKKKDGTVLFLVHWGTNLYTQTGSAQPISIYTALANANSNFFTMGDKCYIKDGTNFLVYDGVTVAQITPYIPTLTLGRAPTGGGTPNEDFNLLGAGFKDSFSSVAASLTYQLSLTVLDATALTATLNGVAKAETTDFTVNRATGAVTLLADPGTGTNNLIITAYKTQTGFADRVKKCTNFVIFGGTNDTRVHISGNPDYPNYVRRSGLYDPTYWPENGYNKVGNDAGKVVGFSKQYDNCVIIKEYSPNDTMVWSMTFDLSSAGVITFPVKPINYNTGCKSAGTVTLVANNPTWLSEKGVFRLVSSLLKDERNTEHISLRIEPNLLAETNLVKAVAIEFDRKYWLAVNSKIYVWDYDNLLPNETIGEWYPYDNFPVACFSPRSDGYLYFGSNATGMVYKVKKKTDTFPYNDDGVAINAYWKSKQTSFFADERQKLIDRVFFSLRPDYKASADLYYISDKKQSGIVKTKRIDLLDYSNINYGLFSYRTSSFPLEVMAKIKAKKIGFFQVILQNNRLNEGMGILSLGIVYRYQALFK